jgi:hypothetical protein
MDEHAEFVVSLWAYLDVETECIYALSGRAYNISGSVDDKRTILKNLAASDYVSAKRYQVPDRFQVNGVDGATKKNLTTVEIFHHHEMNLFKEVFNNIEQELPPITTFIGLSKQVTNQELPIDLLRVATLVCEGQNGLSRTITTPQDLEWLKQVTPSLKNIHNSSHTTFNQIPAKTQSYFEYCIDEDLAREREEYYVNAQDECDGCGAALREDEYFVDGALKNQPGWACLCPRCFDQHGKGIGWGVGQLYRNEGKDSWLLVGGFCR